MSRLMRVAFGVLLAASVNVSASGQGEGAARPLTADQQSAVWQLDQLARSTKEFEDGLLKIRAKAQIADVLWAYDEPRARDIFKEAFREVESFELPQSGDDKGVSKAPDFARLYPLKNRLRSEIISLLSRRDSRFAGDLVKSLTPPASGADAGPATTDAAAGNQTMLYMQLAMRLAETDPHAAARLARLGIGNGINPLVAPALTRIRGTDPALADQLFAYAVEVAQREPVSLTEAVAWMAPYLFPDFGRVPHASGAGARARYVPAQSGPANPALIARYLDFAFAAIITHLNTTQARGATNPGALAEVMSDYQLGRMMVPVFERYAPENAAALRVRLEGIAGYTPPPNGGKVEANSVSSNGVQDLVREAEAAQGTPQKDALYARAAVAAAHGEDFETAFSVIKRISDEPRRNSLETAVGYRAALAAIGKGKLDLAYKYGNDIPDVKQRALVFGGITVELYKRREPDRAAGLLDEAAGFVMDGESGREQVLAMLTLTDAASQFDPARGFELMASAVRAANSEALSQARGAAGRVGRHVDGGAPPAGDVYAELAPDMERSLTPLARLDFNRALSLAQSLRKKELSTFTQLAVCRAVLGSPRKAM